MFPYGAPARHPHGLPLNNLISFHVTCKNKTLNSVLKTVYFHFPPLVLGGIVVIQLAGTYVINRTHFVMFALNSHISSKEIK